jgi:hypothetical protein
MFADVDFNGNTARNKMNDLFSAMLAILLSAVMLAAGQQYLSKRLEITSATIAPLPHVAENNSFLQAR